MIALKCITIDGDVVHHWMAQSQRFHDNNKGLTLMFNQFKLASTPTASKVRNTLLACIMLIATSLFADQPPIDTGPKVGSQLPALSVLDQFGDKQQLKNLVREKGAIIVLFRSADWCSFCKKHLLELNAEVDEFKKIGYGVVGISYDSPKTLRKFSQKKELGFALLSDQQVQTFKAFDVVNIEQKPDSRHYGIPYPGVIVVNNKGEVVQKAFFEGYKERVKFEELLKELK